MQFISESFCNKVEQENLRTILMRNCAWNELVTGMIYRIIDTIDNAKYYRVYLDPKTNYIIILTNEVKIVL